MKYFNSLLNQLVIYQIR